MLSQPEPACLVIADITGYTGFLAGAELDHAQDILADLMSTVAAALRPTFRLAKLEGDAAFVYTIAPTLDGPALQDTVERCYYTFQRRLRDVNNASMCECNACILVPRLDLKLVAHHGQVIRQRIAGRDELVGSDVVVVHRLLKNHVQETTGLSAYALYTDACVAAMGLTDPAAAGLLRHREEFEGVGEIGGWLRDLAAAWTEETARTRVIVDDKDAAIAIEATVAGPPALVWEYVTSPIRRPTWQAAVSAVEEQPVVAGRRGAGTVNHCIHGKDAVVEEVLDWRPYDYVTYRSQMPIPNVPKITSTYGFHALDDGRTRVTMRFGRPRSARDRATVEPLLPMITGMVEASIAGLVPAVEAEMTARAAAAATAPAEPELPESLGRNAREPIAAGT
jgi:uncharacterized protein YndB with AHSA1/START domain